MIAKGRILEWGNSFGVRLSRADVVNAGFHPNDEVEVEVKRKFTTGKDVWGILPRKVDTAKALREIDEMFEED